MAPLTAQAVEYRKAEITKIVDGTEVFIDNGKALEGAVALRGSSVRTGLSRARLLFDPTAIGLMGSDTVIQLGERCFQFEKGRVLVNGKILACFGKKGVSTKMAGSRGTTFVLETKRQEQGYEISVLVGEVIVGDDLTKTDFNADDNFDIDNQYPRLNPSLGVRLDGFTYDYPDNDNFGMSSANLFAPIYQSEGRKLAYSYSSASTNFDDYWAVSTEIGYRWMTASNRSSTGIYVGYGGYDSSSCFNSLLNLGGQWSKDGWTYGISSGLKADDCESGFSFASLSLGIPIVSIKKAGTARVKLSPYLIWGDNIISPFGPASDASNNTAAPGGRLSVNIPASEALSFNVYASYDQVYGRMIGGGVGYRIPFGEFVSDPNKNNSHENSQKISLKRLDSPEIGGFQKITMDNSGPIGLIRIPQGKRAIFSSKGDLLEIVTLKSNEVSFIINTDLGGQDPLPESGLIASYAGSLGVMSPQVSAITGQSFSQASATPVSVSVSTPFDVERPPTANYACRASDEAKKYIVEESLRKGRRDLAKRASESKNLYFGKPDSGLDGYPVTNNPSKAYRFASSGQCSDFAKRIESDKRYSGPSNSLVPVKVKENLGYLPGSDPLQQQK